MGKKLFDYVIGNPPYQDDTVGGNDNYAPQVYNKFLDSAYQVAQKVEMVHPARFLFNAGSTPKEWNQKMLNDSHFKVLKYVSDSQEVFPNVQLTGGVAICSQRKKEGGLIWGQVKAGVISIPKAQDEVLAILLSYIQARVHSPEARPV